MDPSPLLRNVQTVLKDQYDVTLSFCNAQTSLLNAIAPSTQTLISGVPTILQDEYTVCLQRLQALWQQMQDLEVRLQQVSAYRRVATVYKDHVERTQRVLLTVQRAGGGVWSSSHGIPLTTNDGDTVTVALATLRASIETVQDVLSMYLNDESGRI